MRTRRSWLRWPTWASPSGTPAPSSGWRGWLSRPTWRVLVYSAEDPPAQRGLVLVDALNGSVLEHWVEDNPETWITTASESTAAADAEAPSGPAAGNPDGS